MKIMEDFFRILFVEDSPADMEYAALELKRENIRFNARRAETREELIEAIGAFSPDIILSDYYLPNMNGTDVIAVSKQLCPDVPVIIVTGSMNEEIPVACMKAGASDYLLKDKLKRLPFAIREARARKDAEASALAAQTALYLSEQRFKEISEVTGDFIWEVDADGIFTYANRMSYEIIGYTPGELVGKLGYPDILLPEIREQETEKALSLVNRREVFREFINHVAHKEGRLVVLENAGKPIIGPDGTFLGYRGLARDITRRFHDEINLKTDNRNLGVLVEKGTREIRQLLSLNNAIVNNKGLAVIITDQNGKIEVFNPGAERISGYSSAEVTGEFVLTSDNSITGNTNCAIAMVPVHKNPGAPSFRELTETSSSRSFTGEATLLTSGKKCIPVQLTVSLMEDESARVSGYVFVLTDISERIRLYDALKDREEIFRTMFTEHGAVMFLVNPETGLIEEANKSAHKFYGYDFSNRQITIDSINTLTRDELKREMHKAMLHKLNYFHFSHRLAGGEVREVEVHSTPIQVKGKELLFSVIHDITERTRAEQLLRKSEEENRAIISTVPDLLFRISGEGTYLECYASSSASFFVPREMFIGKTIQEILPPDLAAKSLQVIRKAFDTREIVTYEYQLPVGDAVKYFENRVIAINEKEVLSIIRDITDRKTMESSLRWNESLLRLMTGSSPMAFFVVDNRTDEILYFNHRFCEIWGVTELEERMNNKEMKNNDVIPYCLPVLEDINAFAESCKPLQYEENRDTIEDYIPFKDGRTIRRFSTQIRGSNDEYFGRFYIFEDITERRKAEKELQLRESYLSAVVNNHPGIFWLKDTDEKFVFINDKGNTFIRHARIEALDVVIGKTDFEFMSRSLAEMYREEDMEVIRTKLPITIEEKMNIDDREHWYEKFKYPVIDQDGSVIGVAGYSIDITDRKNSQVQLQMQNAAFESFALAMIITDRTGVIQWANPAFARLTGFNPEESIGKKPSILKSGAQTEGFYIEFWSHLLSGKVWSGELINRKKDGSLYHEEEIITPVFDEKGEIARFIAIKIDITRRKEIENALRTSEERWQFALESSGDGIWDWNVGADEVFYSRQWKSMLGFENDEISNSLNEWSDRVHPDDLELCYEELNAHFNGLTPVYVNEHRMLCKDGTYKWILDRGKVIDWKEDRTPLRVIGTHTDITARKMLEEKLVATIETERELNDMKSRFVATASHEFRTPLASILIMSDTLIEYWNRLDDRQISERLQKIKEETLHLSGIVDNVLQLSKIQQGKLVFDPQPHDLIGICQQVKLSLSEEPLAGERIIISTEKKVLRMMLDRNLINQSISNLLSNALKYSQWNSEVRLDVFIREKQVIIQVKDKGIGIPEEEQKHLFTPFFRASNTRLVQGNGLGLNIVRESIRMHGGDVTFKSKPDEGATFVINLPSSLILPS